jgi:hypothetical protein
MGGWNMDEAAIREIRAILDRYEGRYISVGNLHWYLDQKPGGYLGTCRNRGGRRW